MEQALSFIIVIALCMVSVFMGSPIGFLITFAIGSVYLLLRGKKKEWKWPKRP